MKGGVLVCAVAIIQTKAVELKAGIKAGFYLFFGLRIESLR